MVTGAVVLPRTFFNGSTARFVDVHLWEARETTVGNPARQHTAMDLTLASLRSRVRRAA